jgi:hypothetical protein
VSLQRVRSRTPDHRASPSSSRWDDVYAAAVDVDDFSTFIELSHRAGPKPGDREAFLAHRLSRISRSHVLDFVQHLSATREPANTHRLWRAADVLLEGRCSGDGFHYFQMWLVGLGVLSRDVGQGIVTTRSS